MKTFFRSMSLIESWILSVHCILLEDLHNIPLPSSTESRAVHILDERRSMCLFISGAACLDLTLTGSVYLVSFPETREFKNLGKKPQVYMQFISNNWQLLQLGISEVHYVTRMLVQTLLSCRDAEASITKFPFWI